MKALQIDSNNIIINVFEVNSDWSYASDQRSTTGLQGAPEMGNVYDSDQNACYNPQPFNSWSLDSDWNWQPPVQPNRSETHDTNGARIQIGIGNHPCNQIGQKHTILMGREFRL